jgi:hypothetical protein
VATNLALPGFGSLLARRAVGYPQAALTVVGFGLTAWFGVRFGIWYFQNSAALRDADSDPVENLIEIWLGVRWALLGFALFGTSWLWSLSTSSAILRSARQAAPAEKPPVLT